MHVGVRPLAHVISAIAIGAGLQRVAIMGGFAQQIGLAYRDALRAAFDAAVAGGSAQFDTSAFFVIAEKSAQPSLQGTAAFARRRERILA